jgi:hypothetical protein
VASAFPVALRQPAALPGTAITTTMAVLFLFLLSPDLPRSLTNPDVGPLLFVAVPATFVAGELLTRRVAIHDLETREFCGQVCHTTHQGRTVTGTT